MIEVCAAPTPFIIGILQTHLSRVLSLALEDVSSQNPNLEHFIFIHFFFYFIGLIIGGKDQSYKKAECILKQSLHMELSQSATSIPTI